VLTVLCAGLSGCMSDRLQRMDGVTPAAGDAIAANFVMQMVDPWQYGVQDTDLEVPADRGDNTAGAGPSDTGFAGATTGGSSGVSN
jgi:hypothetical protein